MNRSAYHSLIAPYYLKPLSAEAVALRLNAQLHSTAITAAKVRDVFDHEYESGPNSFVFQQLGARPREGFDPTNPKVQLVDGILGGVLAA